MLSPRSFASRNSLPPEGAAAPADWQSQIRGLCLIQEITVTHRALPALFS